MHTANGFQILCASLLLWLLGSNIATAQWAQTPLTNADIYRLISLASAGLVAVTERGDTIFISVGGVDWQVYGIFSSGTQISDVGGEASGEQFLGEIGPFAVGQNASFSPVIFRRDGTNWMEIPIPGFGPLFGVAVHDQTVVAAGNGVWQSSDGGNTFQQGVGLDGASDVVFNHVNNTWYGAGAFGIQPSPDGFVWLPPVATELANRIEVHPTTGHMALATAGTEVKLMALDGTITTLDGGWPQNAFPSDVEYDPQGNLYATYIIYGSPNMSNAVRYDETSQEWVDIGGVSGYNLNDIEYFETPEDAFPSPMLFVATNGAGVWSSEVSTSADEQPGTLPNAFALEQNYPNPFNPTTTIRFSVSQQSFVELKVHNTLGAKIATLVSERLAPGGYTFDWRAEDVASGVYFYQLNAGAFIETRKMMLIR